jgi:hypothetical protein
MAFPHRLAFSAALLAVTFAAPALATDCAGGSTLRLRVTANRVRFDGTVTRPGATHQQFLGADSFRLEVVKAADGALVYAAEIPRAQFGTIGRKTRYDHTGDFQGDVILKNATGQADTVRITFRAAQTGLGAFAPGDLRVSVTSAGKCARTCVTACAAAADGVRCDRSDVYVPFADDGFGALARPSKRPQNPLCGLAIDTSQACDFLIDERCILPYPSSLPRDGRHDADRTPGELRAAGAAEEHGRRLCRPDRLEHARRLQPRAGDPLAVPGHGLPRRPRRVQRRVPHELRPLARGRPSDGPPEGRDRRARPALRGDGREHDGREEARAIIRPGRRLEDATRYIVAIRDLVDTNGAPIRPRLAFRALRDALPGAVVASACGANARRRSPRASPCSRTSCRRSRRTASTRAGWCSPGTSRPRARRR